MARVLTRDPSEILARAKLAYISGFLADIALATDAPFLKDPKASQGHPGRGPSLGRLLQAQSPGILGKCLDIALSVQNNTAWLGFPTITDLAVFCEGARRLVPRLETWTSPW